MASKNYNCTSTVGWSGSAPTNLKSIPIGRTSGGGGAQGKPAPEYGAGKPMPIIRVPKGASGNR
jgi:hypothetical protein